MKKREETKPKQEKKVLPGNQKTKELQRQLVDSPRKQEESKEQEN